MAEKDMEARVAAMEAAITKVAEISANMPTLVATAVAAAMPKVEPPKAEPPKKVEIEDGPLNSMSNKEFKDHLLTALKDDLLEPLGKRIDDLGMQRGVDTRKQEFKDYAVVNPDFLRYGTEIKELLGRHPQLGPRELHVIAKAEVTPERAKEVEEQLQADRVARGEKPVEEPEDNSAIISMFPRAPAREEGSGKMTAEEAGEEAWTQVFGSAREVGA